MNISKSTLFMALFIWMCTAGMAQNQWQVLSSPTTNNLRAVQALDSLHIFICGDAGQVYRSDDAGQTWQNIFPPGSSGNLHDLYFWNPDTGVVVGDNGQIFRTVNGGQFWQRITVGVTDHLYAVSFNGDAGVCGASSQTILRSTDGGQSWLVVQSGYFGGGFWGAEMLSPEIGFIGGENTIFQPLVGSTADSGATWNFNVFYLNSNEGRIFDIAFTDQNIGYAASRVWDGRGAISKTTDGGQTWNTMLFNNALYGIHFPVSNAGQIGYACGANGLILHTGDGGQGWQIQNSGTTVKLNDLSFFGPYSGYAVGDGGTLLRSTPVSVAISPGDEQNPRDFYLGQNYPNPFNPSTELGFRIAEVGFVELKVYDLLAREVKTLVQGELSPGSYGVSWDGRDKNGRPVAGGVYIYRLKAGEFVQFRKMALIR